MEFTAKQIAEFIQGSVEGNENASVHTFAKIEEGVPGAISFLSNPKYTHYLYDTQSSIVLVDRNLELEKEIEKYTTEQLSKNGRSLLGVFSNSQIIGFV